MHLTILAPLAAIFAIAVAQNENNENPFDIPDGFALEAGKPTELTWTPTTPGTVTLGLRVGVSNDLETVETIEVNIPNSGSYTYTPPADSVRNSDYTIEIASDSNPDETNYTPFFVLESKNTVPKQSTELASVPSAVASTASAAESSAVESSAILSSSRTSSTGASSTESTSASSSKAVSGSSSLSRATRTAASGSSAATDSASATTTAESTGAIAAPSSGAVLGVLGGLNIQSGLLAFLLSAIVAW